MDINETVKNFFTPHEKLKNSSSTIRPENVIQNFSDEVGVGRFNDFFDAQDDYGSSDTWNSVTFEDLIQKQMQKIKSYRQIASQSEVSNAVDIITNEIIFSYEDFPLKLHFNEENEQLQQAVSNAFNKIIRLGKFDKNLFNFIRSSYIDGQMICHLTYDTKNIKKGIQQIRMIEPCGLYFTKNQKWKYLPVADKEQYYSIYNILNNKEEYDIEEIVRHDFGLYQDNLCMSYIEPALKTANMLNNLEDLLIPLRFSRSISRRVFNIDIGDLPGKRGEEYMQKVQNAFKYKKFYNNETGEISNQQHITSMVEDYWFANRSGGRGTTVDLLDETNNLGEMNDILYFNKKLYRALHIPTSKLDIDPDADHSFSIDSTEATQEDVKFMAFISRVRKVYCEFFKEILKREIIATGVMREHTWLEREQDIKVEFANENLFIEKMKLNILQSKIEIWENAKEVGGTVFSFEDIMKRVFGLNEHEVEENLEAIKKEIKNPSFKKLYEDAGFEVPESDESGDDEFADEVDDWDSDGTDDTEVSSSGDSDGEEDSVNLDDLGGAEDSEDSGDDEGVTAPEDMGGATLPDA